MLAAAFNADAPQKLGDFVRQFKPAFPVGLVDPNFVSNYSQITPMMRPTVPIMFFIDRNRMIRAQYFGSDPFFEAQDPGKSIRAELEKMLPGKAAMPAGRRSGKTK